MAKSDDIAIKVSNVSKTFKLPHEKHSSLKSMFVNVFRGKRSYERQQVLKDVSFEIKKGEFFGIVGRNGSGKSTLLKLLAGIYTPDKGHIQVNGKLTPFIELGVGFNPELTGRENVFLNGALLGFNRKEMDAMYDEIVEFAELEKFMDQKLKNYSSGMQVRLAFSIAIKSESDVLIFDEVLAVGDENFQKKCIDVFDNYKSDKQTIVLVTHDMETVTKYCSRAMLLDSGRIQSIGSPNKVANMYSKLNSQSIISKLKDKNLQNIEKTIKTQLSKGVSYKFNNPIELDVDWSEYHANEKVKNIGVAIYKSTGEYVFGVNTVLDKYKINRKSLRYKVNACLGDGNYHFKVGLFGNADSEVIEFIDKGPEFIVKGSKQSWEGVAYLEHEWM